MAYSPYKAGSTGYGASKVCNITFKGFDKLYAELRELPIDIQKKVIREATLVPAKFLRDELRTAAPRRIHPDAPIRDSKGKGTWRMPGFLRDNIKVWKDRKTKSDATLVYAIGFTKKAFYGRFTEWPWVHKGGKTITPRPWFVPTFERLWKFAMDLHYAKTDELLRKAFKKYVTMQFKKVA